MKKIRLFFEFKGTLHKKFYKSNVDWEIDISDCIDDDEIFNECSEYLGCLITKGLVDFDCDHGVDDFRLLSYEIDPEGEAERTTFGIRKF